MRPTSCQACLLITRLHASARKFTNMVRTSPYEDSQYMKCTVEEIIVQYVQCIHFKSVDFVAIPILAFQTPIMNAVHAAGYLLYMC
jgi:hypothetical protein